MTLNNSIDNIFSPLKEIVFIDSKVDNYQYIATGIGLDVETVIIDSHSNGIEQITNVLGDLPTLGLLASGITEVFNYTITDTNGVSSNSTLTITRNTSDRLIEISFSHGSYQSDITTSIMEINTPPEVDLDGENNI